MVQVEEALRESNGGATPEAEADDKLAASSGFEKAYEETVWHHRFAPGNDRAPGVTQM